MKDKIPKIEQKEVAQEQGSVEKESMQSSEKKPNRKPIFIAVVAIAALVLAGSVGILTYKFGHDAKARETIASYVGKLETDSVDAAKDYTSEDLALKKSRLKALLVSIKGDKANMEILWGNFSAYDELTTSVTDEITEIDDKIAANRMREIQAKLDIYNTTLAESTLNFEEADKVATEAARVQLATLLVEIDADLDKDEYGDLLQCVNNEIARLDERLSQIAAEEEAARIAAEEEARRQQSYSGSGSSSSGGSSGGSGGGSSSGGAYPPAGAYWFGPYDDGHYVYSYAGESYEAFIGRIVGFAPVD
jgi:uncharacterized membrane protein YgcG